MRFSSYLLVAVLINMIAGCKKDPYKDIENPGISFLYGANSKNDFVLRPSVSPQKVTNLLLAGLRAANPANSDIHVIISNNTTALLNSYNTAHGDSIQPLPATLWSMPSELIIKKGEQYSLGEITVSNTTSLEFNKRYAIGVSITGVSNGDKLANGLTNLFIVFRVQNAMDGRYKLSGQFYHPTVNPLFLHHNSIVELHTTGPNTVRIFWPVTNYIVPYFDTLGTPFLSLPLILTLRRNIPLNNISYIETNSTGIEFKALNSYNNNTYSHRWDSIGGKFYLAFGWNISTSGVFLPGTSRAWIDTLTYLSPR